MERSGILIREDLSHRFFGAQIDAAVSALLGGRDVELFGLPECGQGVILSAVAEEFEDRDLRVLRLNGVRAWRGLPFGAMTTVRASRGKAPERAETGQQQLAAHLAEFGRLAEGAAAIVVESPEWLDAASAGVVVQVSRTQRVPLLASVTRGTAAGEALFPGNGGSMPLRVPVGPLDFGQLDIAIRQRLGGLAELDVVARVAELSGGLHDLALAIVDAAVHTGMLAERGGGWSAVGEIGTTGLDPYLARFTAGLSSAQRELLLAVARHETPLAELSGDGRRDELDALLSAGLLVRVDGALSCYPPFLEEALRAEREGERQAAGAFGAGAESLRASPATLLLGRRMAAAARRELDGLAESWERSHSSRDALRLLLALESAGAPFALIERTSREAMSAPVDEASALLAVWWAGHLAFQRNSLEEGLAALDAASVRQPRDAALLGWARDHLQMMSGRSVPEPEEDEQPIASDEQEQALERLVRVEARVLRGRARDARALLDAPPDGTPAPVLAGKLEVLRGMALILDGELAAAAAHAGRQSRLAEEQADTGLFVAHSYVFLLAQLLAGRLELVHSGVARVLLLATAESRQEPFRVGILNLGAIAEYFRADADMAQALLEPARSGELDRGALPCMAATAARALARAGQPRHQAELLWGLARAEHERGFVVNAAFTGLFSLYLSADAARTRLLQEWTEGSQSALLREIGSLAAVLPSESAEELAAFAARARGAGLGLFAAWADVRAAALCYQRSDASGGFALAERCWEATAAAGPLRAGLFRELSRAVGISAREREVVALAQDGLSTREIASLLSLSVRTVENHSYTAARKAGAPGRSQLIRALASWLSVQD